MQRILKDTSYHHHHHWSSLDLVSFPSTELAGFRMVIDFTTSRHLSDRTYPSLPFLCILFSTCFFTFVLVVPFLCDPAIRNAEPSKPYAFEIYAKDPRNNRITLI